jgi:hypothetical protein
MRRCHDLCMRYVQVNLPDLAMCDAHSVCCHLLPRASAQEPDSEPDTVAHTFSRARARQRPSRALTEAHRVDCRSNVHQGFELLSPCKPSCRVAQNLNAHLRVTTNLPPSIPLCALCAEAAPDAAAGGADPPCMFCPAAAKRERRFPVSCAACAGRSTFTPFATACLSGVDAPDRTAADASELC